MLKPVFGIDGSRLSRAEKTGTETYSDAVIHGLVRKVTLGSWRVYLDSSVQRDHWPGHVDVRTITAPRFWTHGRLSLEMATRPPDLLFVPAHVIPLVHPRSVVTIHDLGYLHVPHGHPARQRRMVDLATRWNAAKATRIIVPSHLTRLDLIHRYGTPADKIRVIYHGVDDRFRDVSKAEKDRVREVFDLGRPYLLAVGTIHPRKDLPTLARATKHLVASGWELELVIAGKDGWSADEVHGQLRDAGLGRRLRILSYVPPGDLPGLYAGAICFVQPSLFEGFGIPVVEAMAAGTAVVCADNSSLPEIAGGGADFFDTSDDKHLAMALERLLSDDVYRGRLVERGVTRSQAFSWERCVSETSSLLLEALEP